MRKKEVLTEIDLGSAIDRLTEYLAHIKAGATPPGGPNGE